MGRALIIGCGGVAGVVIHKCCQNSDVFEEIMIASRTKSKCDAIKEKLDGTTATKIRTAKVDADNVDELCALIDEYKPDIVMNIALPYQDLTIMNACLKCGVNYMDTANYEPEDTDDPEWRAIYEKRCKDEGFTAYFDYSWQWAYKKKFEDAGLTALLGSGFDPGVTQAYCAYAQKHLFDEIDTIDILDCNGGDHITRADYDVETLVHCIDYLQKKYKVQVYLEPGEAVVLNAGYLVSTVLEVMHNHKDIAILDTSAACHMPDVLEVPYRPPVYRGGEPGKKAFTYLLTGRSCLAGDVIGEYSFDVALGAGEQVVFEDMALYTMVKTNTFNGMPLPLIAIRRADGTDEVVRMFGYEEFKRRLS